MKKTDPAKIAKCRALKAKGLSYEEIHKITNVPTSTIHNAIQNDIPTEVLTNYQKNKADILSSKQVLILQNLDSASAKRIMEKQPGAAALWFNSLVNNERLERGQATSISDVDIRLLISQITVDNSQSLPVIDVHNVDDMPK